MCGRVWPPARGSVRSATISVAGPTEPLAAGHTLLLQACTHAHTPGWQAADWSHYSGRLLVTLFRLAAGHTFPAGCWSHLSGWPWSHHSSWMLFTLFRLAAGHTIPAGPGHTIPAGCWSHYSGWLLVTLFRPAAGHSPAGCWSHYTVWLKSKYRARACSGGSWEVLLIDMAPASACM